MGNVKLYQLFDYKVLNYIVINVVLKVKSSGRWLILQHLLPDVNIYSK